MNDESRIESVSAYIESLDIGEVHQEAGLEGTVEITDALADIFSDDEQLVAIGGTITQLSEGVDPEIRSVISNSLLLAHLNTKKILGLDATPVQWLSHYTNVLSNIRWLPASPITGQQTVSGLGLEVKENFIQIVSALIGGTVPLTAASVIIELLQGLDSSEKNKPWVTLFNRETQTASTQLFQLGHAYLNDIGDPEIGLVAITMEAEKDFIQVLFFKYENVSASLNHVSNTIRSSRETLMSHSQQLSTKLQTHTSQFIEDVSI